ncbi:hypothetical protein EJB05_34214, partial [Eragrostis curvula]
MASSSARINSIKFRHVFPNPEGVLYLPCSWYIARTEKLLQEDNRRKGSGQRPSSVATRTSTSAPSATADRRSYRRSGRQQWEGMTTSMRATDRGLFSSMYGGRYGYSHHGYPPPPVAYPPPHYAWMSTRNQKHR